MKKLFLLGCVMAVSAGFAIAQETVSIPFVADNDGTGQATYVGMQNISASSVVVDVWFLNSTGNNDAGDYNGVIDDVSFGADSGGSFTLAPGQSVSFRPAVDDGSEVQGANQVSMPASYNGFGSVTLVSRTGTNAVAGRVVTFAPEGAFSHNVNIN